MVLSSVLHDVLFNPLADPLDDKFGGFLPSNLSGLKAWFRFNSGITVTGAGVSQWDDASGEGNHLLQATDTNRPSKESDGSILFDGVDNYLKTAAFVLDQPLTVYFLGKQVTWLGGDNSFFDGNLGNSVALLGATPSPGIKLYSSGYSDLNNDFLIDTYAAVSVVAAGASSLIQVDSNTSTGEGVITFSPDMDGFTLGARGDAGNFTNIQVKEIIIYNTAHDAATRAKVIAYLNSL